MIVDVNGENKKARISFYLPTNPGYVIDQIAYIIGGLTNVTSKTREHFEKI
jgi:hypothetical protein